MKLSIHTRSRRKSKKAHSRDIRVTLNGDDVTSRCKAFDTRTGRVLLLELKNGQPYVHQRYVDEGPVQRWHMGKVRVTWQR